MLGYATYPDDFSTSSGLKCCWSKDTSTFARSFKYQDFPVVAAVPAGAAVHTIAGGHFTPRKHAEYNQGFATRKGFLFSTIPLGCFPFRIPLKHIFGFASDYKKVISVMKHTLTLTRADDTDALYRNATTNGKVQ